MLRPIFSAALDAHPEVSAWLADLDSKTRRGLRDDVTPGYKEVATEPRHLERLRAHEDSEPTGDEVDDVIDVLRRAGQSELFPELGGGLHGLIMRAARESMPPWQFRAFVAWFRGTSRSSIARNVLGCSRATVRCALDGDGSKGSNGAGAIRSFVRAIQTDEAFMKAVAVVIKKPEAQRPCTRGWFRGINNKPLMVGPLAMLMLLDEMANGEREVRVADVLPLFPPSLISDYMRLLAAYGFAVSNGHTIKIHKTPVTKESAP